ncbi:MICAL-like protein 1 isoform X2 [Halyomorpha halys]|uniref:MICAL-like protein 1 isoform X2 n=1 Tax=Halyomorpha halys TaxID=286706 RepID=UPI000D0C914C|nr:MICAL-like protein 1 isoform X2 [Halyomorpha halys]
MGERRGTKALETWCRRVTAGYPGVKVENMTTSWRDGLAFCALIHHFRPDLIDFSRLDKSDVYGNNDLAFRIAERHLGIPALLDAEDMAEYPVPDRLSILTYLSQFYQAFASNNSSPVKKPSPDSPDGSLVSLVQGNVQPSPKMEKPLRWREPCIVCKQPVFIAQRLRVEGRLYHRTCFRCARCGAQLSAADYYETCSGEYVCETCPDEMPVPEKAVTVVPLQEPIEPPPLPAVPPPSAPPEPPPSLVAMRRLMFDTDDAKLGKHDHIVNNTRIINSLKKDLSKNDDTRSPRVELIDSDNKNLVNNSLDKPEGDSEENLEADSNTTNSEALVQIVNNSTIPACSDISISQRMDDPGQTSPETSEKMDSSTKLISNPEEDKPLDVSDSAPSFNDNPNVSNIENTSHSDSDSNQANTTISIIVTEDEPSDVVEVVEAINNDVVAPTETVIEVANTENDIKEIDNEKPSEEYPDDLNPFDDSGDEEKTEQKTSTNPFGSDSEEEEVAQVMLKPRPRTSSTINTTPQISRPASTNPFDSDDDDEEEIRPVPLPRKSFQSSPEPTPFPRRSRLRSSGRSIASLTSIASSTSPRKKRPAPQPPTPGTLTPSSRYSSISSLASNRPRKNRRAPLPPSLPPKSINEPEQLLNKTEEMAFVPQAEISLTESTLPSLETTGDIANQIEEGMKKLIDEHDRIGDGHIQNDAKEKKDSIDESSNIGIIVDEIQVSNKKDESEKCSDNEENIQTPILEVSSITAEVSKDPNVELNSQSYDKVVEKIIKDENNDACSLVEAYNNEFISRNSSIINSSMIKFDEMEPIKHSTPVKVDVSRCKDGSLEEMPFTHSYSGSFYPSPSGSIADSCSYQESTPPLEKKHKDSTNMHRKISESGIYYPPKSSYGQWKRKKPAPPAPLPQRRIVKPMAIHRIKQELGDIEIKQQELERQGVALEEKIREKFDSDISITPYLEELVLQLFELVNEKNELFRKQAELMYLRRQHQLEEEHAELEFQIRCLMARPEVNKTDTDKELEEKLIQRLIEVVERRDAIVQCLEMDRLREAEEDKSIHKQLDRFSQAITDERMKVTKKHKKKKDKHNTLKMLDIDKDFDESEKESKKKKKWYTLHPKVGKHL